MKVWQILLTICAGAAAVVVGAYYMGLFDPPVVQRSEVASAPNSDQAAKPAGASTPKQDRPSDAAPAATAETSAEPVIAPAFDIVRVEPSGDLVIAGSAAPGATVQIVTGNQVLAQASAGEGGQFAAVLDTPLKPGDYQIVLRSTTTDGVTATSPETAVVSIPESKSGQVLALVEQPGAPSRLITKPEPSAPAEKAVEPESGEQAGTEATPAADTAQEEAQSKPATEPSPKAEAASDTAEPETGDKPEMAETPTETVQAQPESTTGGEAASAGTEAKPDQPETAVVARAEEPAAEKPQMSKTVEAAGNVSVEAVEIDGREVFVAGVGKPGSQVRIYANDILLGQTTVSPVGRFLLETVRDLPVGDYIIRADMLDEAGSKVVSRAAVPFEREAGETIAAVAAPATSGAAEGAASGSSDELKTETPATAGQPSDSPSAETEAPAGAAGNASEQQAAVSPDTEPAPDAAGDSKFPPLDTVIANTPPEIIGSKLSNVNSSVIIRRGDNLWRISRRVYGRGIRYTTIYLANQDQIRDPDRIWPGQVFDVPERTPEGEVADRTLIDERIAEQKEAERRANSE